MTTESKSPLTLSIETLKRAVAADVANNYEEAFFLYGDGIEQMRAAGETITREHVLETIAEKLKEYEGRRARLKKFLHDQPGCPQASNVVEQSGLRHRTTVR